MAGTISPPTAVLWSACSGLNGVRPRWPEQWKRSTITTTRESEVSMESGLDGRNNEQILLFRRNRLEVSMESGLDGRNNWQWSWARLWTSTSQWSPA